MSYDRSPIDELFNELYGFYPNKAGQSYEMLVAAAFKLLLNEEISYDQRLRGKYSNTSYQLDGLIHNDPDKKMIEAKDYTILNSKVGRGDLQKLQGALIELPVGWGVFASATGYTSPAKKYAVSSVVNPQSKPIQLYDIRPSTIEDEKGRIMKIIINLHRYSHDFNKSKMSIIWTEEAKAMLAANGCLDKPLTMTIDKFYNKAGNVLITIHDLSLNSQIPLIFGEEDYVATGCWIVRNGYLKLNDELYPIVGVEYSVPTIVIKNDLIIESGGSPRLYIKAEDGSINKLINDEELKKVSFRDGKVYTDGSK